MRRLAVLAHYDADGLLAASVRHQAEALVAACDDVVMVTVSPLSEGDRTWLRERLTLIERDNVGYDFYSYKVGLDSVDLTAYDEVLICNDTWIGPLLPLDDLLHRMDGVTADFWGITRSEEIEPHVQSFFVVFRARALRSPAFASFWSEMEPVSDRDEVIRRYEIGLSSALHGAGLTSAAYFEPTAAERRRARRRLLWWAADRIGAPRNRARVRRYRRWMARETNPTIALADAAFDGERLPLVKIAALRYDQYRLDAERLLRLGEQRHPEAFAGVREYLERTSAGYTDSRPDRQPRRWLRPLQPTVRYRAR